MKYIIIICMFVTLSVCAQDKGCGTWDAKVVDVQRVIQSHTDTLYFIIGQNFMPDCITPSGIMFVWRTDKPGASELRPGMFIDFEKWQPQSGVWKYHSIYLAEN